MENESLVVKGPAGAGSFCAPFTALDVPPITPYDLTKYTAPCVIPGTISYAGAIGVEIGLTGLFQKLPTA